ncbi:MAG: type III pantothenate kinase [Candidatus Endonucleobacter bathymodioli]|uniref:Type III pantothenate kinase n=1 Tax=Candidatus Endonucleibacter bathymodioli TaxID=539814 RepID=A0AA90NNR6_9GAMM|nr:type III pantothenate kinase [Candidatus Endonucleobacter bathymodioli]
MLLAIDMGNTNTAFGFYDLNAQSFVQQWYLETRNQRTSDEYLSLLSPVLQKHANITDIIISSVVPDVTVTVQRFCHQHLHINPIIVDPRLNNFPITINIDDPAQLGADRLVNAIAAKQKYKTPIVIVDFGTATTFDVIGEKGAYDGGVIAPGVNLSLEALHNTAAKLPKIAISENQKDNIITKNVYDAMQAGIYWGYVSMVEGCLSRIDKQLGIKSTHIATGGLGRLFNQQKHLFDSYDPNLSLEGLVILYTIHRYR